MVVTSGPVGKGKETLARRLLYSAPNNIARTRGMHRTAQTYWAASYICASAGGIHREHAAAYSLRALARFIGPTSAC